MIDYVRLKLPSHYKDSLLANTNLEFVNPHIKVLDDGEIVEEVNPKKKFVFRDAVCKGQLTISIYNSGAIYLSGSIQKFFFDGVNHMDYTLDDFRKTINDVQDLTGVDLSKCKIQRIELSINIHGLPLPTERVIKGLVGSKAKGSTELYKFKDLFLSSSGSIKKSERTELTIKIYDKAEESNVSFEIFRFELVLGKSRMIQKSTGALTLNDFLRRDVFENAGKALYSRWSEVILFDDSIERTDDNLKFSNYDFWSGISKDSTKLYRARKELAKISKSKGCNIHAVIGESIKSKWQKLYIGSPR